MTRTEIKDFIRVHEERALGMERGAASMLLPTSTDTAVASAHALSSAAQTVSEAAGIRRVTMSLRGAAGISVDELPETGSPADGEPETGPGPITLTPRTIIASAYIDAPGAPSVGIPSGTIHVEHLGFDLRLFAADEMREAANDLVKRLTALGEVVMGEPCVITLLDDEGRAVQLPPEVPTTN